MRTGKTHACQPPSDPGYGPLIGIQTYTSDVLAKEGTPTAGWETEHTDTDQVAVAG